MNSQAKGQIAVAYQGEPGAFSEVAALELLGPNTGLMPCRTFEEMFEAVSSGNAHCAVAPIENSLAGSVHKNYDLLVEHDLAIIGEVNIRIVHNLIGLPGASISDVRHVYSHPVALAQCERFLRQNPQVQVEPSYDTAGSVKMIVENRRVDEAAIASAGAATLYGAQVLAPGIEDNAANFTRFLLLSRPDQAGAIRRQAPIDPSRSRQKTSIVFRVANRPGVLFRALAAFALRDIDLTKIESRPIEGRPWEYSFYVDLAGDPAEPAVRRALEHLEEMTESIRVLGSYPRARRADDS